MVYTRDAFSKLVETILAKTSLRLDKMAFEELLQLRDEVETALNGKIAMERRELRGKLAEIDKLEARFKPEVSGRSATAGSRAGLGGGDGKSKARKKIQIAPKYRGPNNETWAGRGLAPKWLTELEKKGRKREQFLINKA